jgi:predicted lipoprotein with Yx(FWY)xxD motif
VADFRTSHIRADEETNDMEHTNDHRGPIRRVPVGRIAAAALALGGLSAGGLFASLFVAGTAGAMTSHVVIATAENATLGTILVSGTSLYTLKPSKTGCAAACVKIWPEVLLPRGVKKATAGTGVNARKLGTVRRAHGARQVTYAGKALYWYTGDTAPGQVNGNLTDSWGTWSVATAGAANATSGSGTGSGTGSGVTTTSRPSTGGVSF